ncbi:SpoIIE family protein phosphatase [Pantoea rodasii]|nr:SpoIIE family protein phosphatase [Pantoea rodasii]
MDISWKSQKGSSRKNNNDYVAIGVNDGHFIAVIVDASDKGKTPCHLAEYWAKTLLTNYIRHEHESVVMLLKEIHKTLIPVYLTESASYTLIDVDLKNRSGNVVYVGDCRLGVSNNCNTHWVNAPHTIINTFPDLNDSYANLLTRVLKARRFTPPEQVNFAWKDGEMLLLCTDGYWRPQSDNRGLNHDDVSVLKVRLNDSGFTLTVDSDCNNIFVAQ